ncbi:MAG: acyltransferase [Glaciimonas sp.]|nr:acyltransferase [Glaciimonas sp.]
MKYRSEIDGLRALAVVPVMLFHAGFSAFSGGYVGVDIFFVISGYLITTIILNEKFQNSFSVINFYERRVRRIMPGLFFVMLATLPLAWQWLLPNEFRRFSDSLVAIPIFLSNFLFFITSGYFGLAGELKPFLHTWSLAVEEQYYVIFPLILMSMWRFGGRWLIWVLGLLFVLSLMLAQVLSSSMPVFNFFMLPSRFFELLMGSLAAFYLFHRKRPISNEMAGWLGIILIVISVVAFDVKTPFPGLYTLFPTIGALLIIIYSENTRAGNMLAAKPLVGIGLISYSTYLWHQPLFSFARHRSLAEPSKSFYLMLIFASFLLAYITWKYVEAPFRNKTKFSRKSIFLYFAICSLFFILFGLLGHITGGFPGRLDKSVSALSISKKYEDMHSKTGCHINMNGSFSFGDCIGGRESIEPRFALIGDSHAQTLVASLSDNFKKKDISFIPFVMSGCALNFFLVEVKNKNNGDCIKYQRAVLSSVYKLNLIETYIVDVRLYDNSSELTPSEAAILMVEGNVKSIKKLIALGKTVILVHPVPQYDYPISVYMAKNLMFYGGVRAIPMEGIDSFRNKISFYQNKFSSIPPNEHLKHVYPENIFCDSFVKDYCVAQNDGIPFYWDGSHLTNEGAELVVQEILKWIH